MARGDELKLLGMFLSPFALRVNLALSFKGLSYEYIEENDLHSRKSELLLKSNLVHKEVPVLIHNGRPVCGSQIIVQYIDEVYCASRPTLLPIDRNDRAMALFLAAYIDDKLLNSLMMMIRANKEEEEVRKQSLVVAETLEGALRQCSKGKAFFGGDSVGYLDVVLGGFVPWVHTVDILTTFKLFDAAKTPLLAGWLERFGALDTANKAMLSDVERLVDIAKLIQAQAELAAEIEAQGKGSC